MNGKFSYEKSQKTDPENKFLNLQSFLFVTSGALTRFFYYTKVSPHQVILLSMIFGISASYLLVQDEKYLVIIGALLLFYKNVLDKVDGSLARAKGLDSRRGRFYDSISDFIVTAAVFSAIIYKLILRHNNYLIIAIGLAAMLCSMLQCSYFIFYQVSFIISTGKKTVNRLIEKVTDDDIKTQDKWTIFLQRVFMLIYGWQDKLFAMVDKMLFRRLISSSTSGGGETVKLQAETLWYQNEPFLTLASSLSIGSHIFLICIAALFDVFEYYFFVNLICMNLLLIFSVIFHYKSSEKHLNSV